MKKKQVYLFLTAFVFLILWAALLLNTGCKSKDITVAESKDTAAAESKNAETREDLVKVTIVGIKIDTSKMMPAILLKEADGEKYLPILIGRSEAYSIALEMADNVTPRPLTHDLIIGLIEELNASIEYIVISDLKNDIFYAEIYLKDEDNIIAGIDSRPSDAIALAVRVECDIFVKKDILDEYGIEIKSQDEQYMEI